jgi:uncharacterized protein YdeI (YjbR/CyaY-like superfamily)
MCNAILRSILSRSSHKTRPISQAKFRFQYRFDSFLPGSGRPVGGPLRPLLALPLPSPIRLVSTMSAKESPSDLPTHSFPSASAFETFLETNHLTAPGIYLKLAKKSSGIPSVSSSEAVEVALCFGWIDGRANSLDDNWWTVRYTPRRAKSMWSQKNVNTVARLVEQGKMRPAGLEAVDTAKSDGRWDRAYAGPATIEVPKDLAAALKGEPKAKKFFEGMNSTDRYAVLWRVQTATPKARAQKIETLVEMLAKGRSPHVPAKSETKLTKPAVSKSKVTKSISGSSKPTSKRPRDAKTLEDNPQRPVRRAGLRSRP